MKTSLKQQMMKYCETHSLIRQGESLIVALSGGPDSVCLFHMLSDISAESDLTLTAVHVHHGIRGAEADRDAAFSRSLSETLQAGYVERHVDAPAFAKETGRTLEEAARYLRYRELESVCEEKGADAIVLAHHLDDQAETVWMNLMRGTGPTGLAGMRPRNGRRIRPLLFASKKEILEYLQENQIKYITDSTNLCDDYTRNRIRNEWFPMMEERFPGAREHIAAAAEDIGIWADSIRARTLEVMGEDSHDPGEIRIDAARFRRQDPAIRREWIRQALLRAIPCAKDVNRTHYEQIEELLEDFGAGRRISLPGGFTAVREYDGVVIRSYVEPGDGAAPVPLCIPGETKWQTRGEIWSFLTELVDVDIFNKKKSEFLSEKDYTKFIDYDTIRNGLCVRCPQEGDYFILDEQGRKKKLSRFFIDSRVSRDSRMDQPVIADGSHIVWVMDRMSASYYVTEQTQQIVKIVRRVVPIGRHGGEHERRNHSDDR